jgi:hypothetical protein
MGVIRHQRQGVTSCLVFRQKSSQPLYEIVLVPVVSEYFATLNSADDDVM